SRSGRPPRLASALWSITANTVIPFADSVPVRRETVSVTDLGLTLVVISVSVQLAMAGLLSPSLSGREPMPMPAASICHLTTTSDQLGQRPPNCAPRHQAGSRPDSALPIRPGSLIPAGVT